MTVKTSINTWVGRVGAQRSLATLELCGLAANSCQKALCLLFGVANRIMDAMHLEITRSSARTCCVNGLALTLRNREGLSHNHDRSVGSTHSWRSHLILKRQAHQGSEGIDDGPDL